MDIDLQKNSFLNLLGLTRNEAIKWLVTIMIGMAIILVPVSELFTVEMKKYCFVTVVGILLVAFEIFPMVACALIIPAGYIVLNVATPAQALAGYTNVNFFMVFGTLVFAYACLETGFLNRFSLWIVMKLGRGSYTRTLFALTLAGSILGLVTLNGQQIVMITLAIGICAALKKNVGIETALLMNAAQISYLTVRMAYFFPLQHALLATGGQTIDPNFAIEWQDPLVYGWIWIPATFGLIALYAFIFKTKNISFGSGMDYLQKEYAKLGKMTKAEKKCVVYMLCIMGLVMTSSWHKIASSTIFMTLPFVAFLPGIKIATSKVFGKLPWGPLLLTPACLAFGTIGMELGIGDLLTQVVSPLLSGTNPFIFFGALFIVVGALNFILTPLAILTMLAVPVAQLAFNIGIDPMASMLSLYYSAEIIFMPHESTGYLLLFSFGMMKMKDFMLLQSIKSIYIFTVFLVLVVPYWILIGLC